MGEHEKPGGWRGKVKAVGQAVRRFLKLEPALIGKAVAALVVLGTTVGVLLPAGLEGKAVAIFTAVGALVTTLEVLWTRSRVTPAAVVVEKAQLQGNATVVVAGPANDQIAEGDAVRLLKGDI